MFDFGSSVLAAQTAQALVISVLLYLFSRVFRRDPLHHWAWSWGALATYYVSLLLRGWASGTAAAGGLRLVGTIAALWSGLWLILGLRAFVGRSAVARVALLTAGVGLFGVIAVLLPLTADNPVLRSYGTWTIRCATIGSVYLWCGLWLARRGGRASVGKVLLVGSFLLYGSQLLHYATRVGLAWLEGRSMTSTGAWGVIDIVLQAVMGLGTVVWLLEREHEFVVDATRRLQELAFFDPTTRLPNWALLESRSDAALRQASSTEQQVGMLVLDLDRFNRINSSFGHAEGDAALVRVARRIEPVLRAGDTLARRGADRFVVLAPDVDAEGLAELGRRILDRVRQPMSVGGSEVVLTASAGGALFPGDARTTGELLRCCELSLLKARAAGRDQMRAFLPTMSSEALVRLSLESSLRRALASAELELYFQPIWDLSRGSIEAVEALLRWRHPADGILRPHQFLREAEQAGLSMEIVAWSLEEACRRAVELQQIAPGLWMAVNLDALSLQRPDLPEAISGALRAAGLDPRSLVVELTENAAMLEPALGRATLRRLRSKGIRVALDDFGTGYSSLSQLRTFPIDILKIDQSFVQGLGSSHGAEEIVQTVLDLACNLGLEVVAEGVESDHQSERLQGLGCRLAQGFLLSPPLPLAELEELLEEKPPAALPRSADSRDGEGGAARPLS